MAQTTLSLLASGAPKITLKFAQKLDETLIFKGEIPVALSGDEFQFDAVEMARFPSALFVEAAKEQAPAAVLDEKPDLLATFGEEVEKHGLGEENPAIIMAPTKRSGYSLLVWLASLCGFLVGLILGVLKYYGRRMALRLKELQIKHTLAEFGETVRLARPGSRAQSRGGVGGGGDTKLYRDRQLLRSQDAEKRKLEEARKKAEARAGAEEAQRLKNMTPAERAQEEKLRGKREKQEKEAQNLAQKQYAEITQLHSVIQNLTVQQRQMQEQLDNQQMQQAQQAPKITPQELLALPPAPAPLQEQPTLSPRRAAPTQQLVMAAPAPPPVPQVPRMLPFDAIVRPPAQPPPAPPAAAFGGARKGVALSSVAYGPSPWAQPPQPQQRAFVPERSYDVRPSNPGFGAGGGRSGGGFVPERSWGPPAPSYQQPMVHQGFVPERSYIPVAPAKGAKPFIPGGSGIYSGGPKGFLRDSGVGSKGPTMSVVQPPPPDRTDTLGFQKRQAPVLSSQWIPNGSSVPSNQSSVSSQWIPNGSSVPSNQSSVSSQWIPNGHGAVNSGQSEASMASGVTSGEEPKKKTGLQTRLRKRGIEANGPEPKTIEEEEDPDVKWQRERAEIAHQLELQEAQGRLFQWS